MNFKKFLGAPDTDEIQEKCKPFLEQAGGLPLYRGFASALGRVGGGTTITVRKDRKPRDSGKFAHDLLDTYFLKKVGAKIRSEGLFVTGELRAAAYYGHPYYIFPVGDFKFVWGDYKGTPVKDTLFATQNIHDLMQVSPKKDADKIAASVLDDVTWHTTDLKQAIKSGAEIVILCDQALAVKYSDKVSYKELIGG